MLLPLFLIRANRRGRALLALVPLLAVSLVLEPLRLILDSDSFGLGPLVWMFGTLMLGLTSVWLLFPWFQGRNRGAVFFLGLLVMAGVGAIAATVEYGGGLFPYLLPYGLFSLTLLLALVLAGRFCRRSFTPGRFIGLAVPAAMVAALLVGLPLALVAMAFALASGAGGYSFAVLLTVGISALVTGPAVWLLALPFLLLAFGSAFHRARFDAVFRLKQAAAAPAAPASPEVPA